MKNVKHLKYPGHSRAGSPSPTQAGDSTAAAYLYIVIVSLLNILESNFIDLSYQNQNFMEAKFY